MLLDMRIAYIRLIAGQLQKLPTPRVKVKKPLAPFCGDYGSADFYGL